MTVIILIINNNINNNNSTSVDVETANSRYLLNSCNKCLLPEQSHVPQGKNTLKNNPLLTNCRNKQNFLDLHHSKEHLRFIL